MAHADHATIIEQLETQFSEVLERSPDGVYLWLDETHKTCNAKLAKMFGYDDPAEWSAQAPFLDTFVAPEDRETYSANYHRVVGRVERPATFRFRGLKKDGSTFGAETDMIPIAHDGHVIAYHFVREL